MKGTQIILFQCFWSFEIFYYKNLVYIHMMECYSTIEKEQTMDTCYHVNELKNVILTKSRKAQETTR